jgi:hypothetical protein
MSSASIDIIATAARTPMAMPAIVPPDIPRDTCALFVGSGNEPVEVEVEEVLLALELRGALVIDDDIFPSNPIPLSPPPRPYQSEI